MGDDCCATRPKTAAVCPECGAPSRSVDWLTVAALTHNRVPARQDFRVCARPDCPVAYHGEDGTVIPRTDLATRPGYKEPSGPESLLCYCFLHTRGDLERQLRATGTTKIPAAVRAKVKANNCACEVRNPRGACCLGEIERAVREIGDRIGSGLARARSTDTSRRESR